MTEQTDEVGSPYEVGLTVTVIDPAEEQFKHMLHLVAYDIRNPRRLRRVAKVCEGYGIRVEYSVFECDLAAEMFQRLWAELSREINWEQDAILAYRICGSCVRQISSMGQVVRPQKVLVYML